MGMEPTATHMGKAVFMTSDYLEASTVQAKHGGHSPETIAPYLFLQETPLRTGCMSLKGSH